MEKKLKQKFIIIVFGPTAVGKSSFAEKLAHELKQAQIVNCDVGQFYTKLSIGTAKPDWMASEIKQHMFDIVDEPKDFNVRQYREHLLEKVEQIWAENSIPVLVGGSGFYLKSLFFPPLDGLDCLNSEELGDKSELIEDKSEDNIKKYDQDLWQELYEIDPERAKNIDKNDIYRIKRALDLWLKTGIKPSELAPVYNFPSNFLFIFLSEDRKVLYEKINIRTDQMIKDGWINEVEDLIAQGDSLGWESFLKKKKLIGYDLIIDYLNNIKNCKLEEQVLHAQEMLLADIKKKTRNYAKRQMTFWRFLEKHLKKEVEKNKYTNKVETRIEEFKLDMNKKTSELFTCENSSEKKIEIDLYIKQLLAYLEPLFNS